MIMIFSNEREKEVATLMFINKERAFYRYALWKLKSTHDAEEALCITNLKMSKYFQKIDKEVRDDPELLAGYTFRILQNVCRDICNARGRAPVMEDVNAHPELTVSDESETTYFVIDGKDVDSARAALRKLSSRNLDFMVMYFLTKKDKTEVAAEFGLSLTSARDKVYKLKRSVIKNTKEAKKHAQ